MTCNPVSRVCVSDDQREYLRELEEALTLLAFKDPTTSPLAHLLDTNHRHGMKDEGREEGGSDEA